LVRTVKLGLLLAGLVLLLPAGALGATPGVNVGGIPGPGLLDEAASSGARQIRVFVLRNQIPGHIPEFKAALAGAKARGMGVVFVLMGDSAGSATNPGEFAAFASDFSTAMAEAGGAVAYEVWNEPDEAAWWRGPPNAGEYVALLKATAPKIRAGDPGAKVILGPTTGNNHKWLQSIYARGAKGSFDGVAVHTDTACLIAPPSAFQRENGKVGRFSFLGFISVRGVMLANGDGEKKIWMTELGWSSATSPCTRGMFAGQKPAGVGEATQAANLAAAYSCLAGYPYVENALWFSMNDTSGDGDELGSYGLRRIDGSPKPSWDAFRSVAQGNLPTAPCGDLTAPSITLHSPSREARYDGALVLKATAKDATAVARITFKIDGKTIRNYTGADVASGRPVRLEWQGAKRIAPGRHRLTVVALDPNRNTSTKSVRIRRVPGR
jgi:hypothetical protein